MSVQVSFRLKEIQKWPHDFKLNKVPLYSRKSVIINVSLSAAPKPKWLCQVSLGLKEVQMGAHDFKLNKGPLFS